MGDSTESGMTFGPNTFMSLIGIAGMSIQAYWLWAAFRRGVFWDKNLRTGEVREVTVSRRARPFKFWGDVVAMAVCFVAFAWMTVFGIIR